MTRSLIALFLATMMAGTAAAQGAPAPAPNRDPDQARLVTDDIVRFWQVYDRATLADAAEQFQTGYIDAGSPGVRIFTPNRLATGRHVAASVLIRTRYYAAIRATTMAVDTAGATRAAIRQSLHRLKAIYPDAVFPDVYFVIGRMNSGGTAGPAGLVIGTELYARTPDTPTDELNDWERSVITGFEMLPAIVAHELIHFQQPSTDAQVTLLSQSIREGAADFIGEMISDRLITQVQHDWANPREVELWEEFRGAMAGSDLSGWLYQGDQSKDRPADLGYWMGYRIVKAFYERAEDKAAAIRRILTQADPELFLRESGYPERFSR